MKVTKFGRNLAWVCSVAALVSSCQRQETTDPNGAGSRPIAIRWERSAATVADSVWFSTDSVRMNASTFSGTVLLDTELAFRKNDTLRFGSVDAPSDQGVKIAAQGLQQGVVIWTATSELPPSTEPQVSKMDIRSVTATRSGGTVNEPKWDHNSLAALDSATTPLASFTFDQPIRVFLTLRTPKASIRYTRDGTDPTESSLPYDSAKGIFIDSFCRISAIGTKGGWNPSGVVDWNFNFRARGVSEMAVHAKAWDSISPELTKYDKPVWLTLTSPTPDAEIHYTLDGTTPDRASPLYADSLWMDSSRILKAIVFAKKDDPSTLVFSRSLTLKAQMVQINLGSSPGGSLYKVGLSCPTSGVVIHYTRNGRVPTVSDSVYTDSLVFPTNDSMTIRAIAIPSNPGILPSAVSWRRVGSDGTKFIPGGTFQMGSPVSELGRDPDEVQHAVTLSSFWMDSAEVTQSQYQALMGVNPSIFSTCGATCPVENVTWFDAVLFCNARSKSMNLDTVYSYTSFEGTLGNGTSKLNGIAADFTKKGYRLPTEAEREYAARGGTITAYYWGDDSSDATVGQYAWYANNSFNQTHPVATKRPNAFGLYDMEGNVWQWTNDCYGNYSTSSSLNPKGPFDGDFWVARGGCWSDTASIFRSAYRSNNFPYYHDGDAGFRSVRSGQ